MFQAAILCAALWVISRCLEQKFKIIHKLKFALSFIYVWILKRKTPLIFGFDFRSKDIRKFGITSLPEAWHRECPRTLQPSIHASDTLGFCGVHQDGSVLVARITRRHDRIAETWVYLRLPSGEEYQLPNHPDTKIYNIGEREFSSGGLTFEVLEPLKCWRVLFNGYLRRGTKTEWDNSEEGVVAVSFNFIWHPMYNYVAFPQDFSCTFLADVLAARQWSKQSVASPTEIFPEESVEILGHFHGEVKIEDEKELIIQLRGLKERKHGILNWAAVDDKLSIKGILENGLSFHLFAERNKESKLRYLYGYVLPPCNMTVYHVDSFSTTVKELFPIRTCPKNVSLQFNSGKRRYSLEVTVDDDAGFVVREGKEWDAEVTVRPIRVTLNGREGLGIMEYARAHCGHCPFPADHSVHLLREPDILEGRRDALVVSLLDVECRSSKVVGGKGASLANMLSVPCDMYSVPLGVCVTNSAYEMHLHHNPSIVSAIVRMQNVAWKKISGCLAEECDSVVNAMNSVASIPEKAETELRSKLEAVFGKDYDRLKFAVRSSAIGEDGDELSSAGQNETFLGIVGFDNICSNILKCWSSQFAFRSIEYKRQNGQLFNAGMGVVVQVMVPAEVAGVLFSRDPLTGSMTKMLISSNFGLGESVVSACADPDAITLKRSWNDKVTVLKKEIGSKKHMITLADGGGTIETAMDEAKSSTLTLCDKMAIKLGQIAIFQEKYFGNPRDIEWAIRGDEIFLLQSRPVTVDGVASDFEIMHEFDTAPRTDREMASTANVGEVMPGATSPLGATTTIRTMSLQLNDLFSWKTQAHRYDPIVFDGWMSYYGHMLFDRIQQKTWSMGKKTTIEKASDLGLYGRILDDDDVTQLAVERFENPPLKSRLALGAISLKGVLFGPWYVKRARRNFQNVSDPTVGSRSIKEAYEAIGNQLNNQINVLYSHMCVTFGSTIWNLLVLNVLSNGSSDFSTEQYTDLSKIIGSGIGAESGNVPYSLQKLARIIGQEIDAKKFTSWSAEHALQWLQESAKDSGRKFQEFLTRHGHRGVKEFDIMTETWAVNPLGVVRILQDTLRLPEPKNGELNSEVVDELSGIKTPLTPFRKFLLRLVMKGSRLGVCQRETCKSLVIRYTDSIRQGFRRLANMMVAEGYLPDPNLIFFFTYEEIERFLNTRSASLLRRVKHRCRLHPKMDRMRFPEMVTGFPVPIDDDDETADDEITDSIKGFPVSQGVIRGPAKVVDSFLDIGTIRPGDILITYSTDIGWSPYFPMLSGVVTELGGLISHGAVVAREFGLPCIVGAQRATKVFKSGDIVLLDANKGILSKVHSTICQVG